MRQPALASRRGFSLIEIIITLVLFGLVGAMLMPFFLSGVTKSALPVQNLNYASNFNSVMSAMVTDYYQGNYTTKAKLGYPLTGTTLSDLIGATSGTAKNTKYGKYVVLDNQLYTLSGASFSTSGCPAGVTCNYLIVTIQNPSNHGEVLTHVFTVQN